MKIIFVCHQRRFKADMRPGRLARLLASRGHAITLVCIADEARLKTTTYETDGVRYIETPDLLFGSLRSGWDPLSIIRRMGVLSELDAVDLVHIFETRPATIYPVKRLLKAHPVPLVIDWIDWWGRGGIITTNRPRWYQVLFGGFETFYEEHYRTLADATTVICSALGQRAEGLGVHPDSIFRIPIGADTEHIPFVDPATYRPDFKMDPNAKIAVFSAMDAVMDVDLVFASVKEVLKALPEFQLVMTGNGADELRKKARQVGIGDCFTHLGRLPVDRFYKALTCADVFLLPFSDTIYNRGRWPCKMGDYLAAGRPIVSNPVGEVQMLLERFDVGVFAKEDPMDFADKTIQLLSDADALSAKGQEARRVAETDLAWDGIIDQLELSYEYALQHFEKGRGDS